MPAARSVFWPASVEEVEEDTVARNEARKRARARKLPIREDIGDPLGRLAVPPVRARPRRAVPAMLPAPARSRPGSRAIRAGSRPSRVLVPARIVTGRSVLSRSVKHGTPR